MKATILLLASAALGCFAVPAGATVITRTYNIKASGFGAGAPVDAVAGSFTLTYDKDAPIIPQTTNGLSIAGFNLPYDGAARFSYQRGGDFLTISNNFTGFFAYTLGGAGNKFGFSIMNLSTAPKINVFGYSKDGAFYNASRVTVTQGAVPEPASWALMIAGFGMVGATLRSRRTTAALA